jgi:hypothetical protein
MANETKGGRLRTRREIMNQIHDSLLDGHPNPEGFIEWCEGLSDKEFMYEFATEEEVRAWLVSMSQELRLTCCQHLG